MIDEIRLRWEYIVDNPHEIVFSLMVALAVAAFMFAIIGGPKR